MQPRDMLCAARVSAPLVLFVVGLALNGVTQILAQRGDFTFEVEFHSYNNPTHAAVEDGNCCDKPLISPPHCTDTCSNYFLLCLREYESTGPELFTGCPFGVELTTVVFDNDNIVVQPDQRIQIPGSSWPGRIQLLFETYNTDPDFNDELVDTVLIDLDMDTLFPGDGFTPPTTYSSINGYFTVNLSFQVRCAPNYYDSTCSTFCDASSQMGNYVCSRNGELTRLDATSTGAIAGGVVGSIAAVTIVSFLVVFIIVLLLWKRRKVNATSAGTNQLEGVPATNIQPIDNPNYTAETQSHTLSSEQHNLYNPIYGQEPQAPYYASIHESALSPSNGDSTGNHRDSNEEEEYTLDNPLYGGEPATNIQSIDNTNYTAETQSHTLSSEQHNLYNPIYGQEPQAPYYASIHESALSPSNDGSTGNHRDSNEEEEYTLDNPLYGEGQEVPKQ